MIVITGATGQLGSQIVDRLLERVPAEQVGVSVRDPAQAAHLAARGVRVRQGDFTDPSSLAHAFKGAEQVLLVSANVRGGGAVAAHRVAVDAARAAGAERVLYTSHQGAAQDSLFEPARGHAATEQHLSASGGAFTALRNGFYATTVPFLLGRALETGTLSAPADGSVSWTAHADLAEATAVVLAQPDPRPDRFDGVSPPLTGPEVLDLEAVAGILSDLTGRRISRVILYDQQWKAQVVGHGMPEAAADFSLGMYRASRRGEFAVTDPALEQLIQRPATPLRALLERVVGGG